jgi:hypothetical protein
MEMATEVRRNERAQDPRWSPPWLDWNFWENSEPSGVGLFRSVTSNQSRDPELQQPCWLHPWEQSLPEAPGGGITLREALEVPVLGPGSNSGAPQYDPMSIEPPNIDPGGSLLAAEHLNWKA